MGLRDANQREVDTGGSLDAVDLHLLLHGPERDTRAGLAGARCPARSVDVRLRVFWWLDLDNQVDVGDVKSSACDISRNEDRKLLLLESFEGHLPLVLCNISVHDFNVLADLL